MSDDTAITVPTPEERALALLSVEERVELERFRRSGKPGLSPQAALKLYQLWVEGVTCQEIVALKPEFSLGLILHTRIDQRWDLRREAYLADLYLNANDRLKQVGAEALNFLSIVLAAAHKDHGERLKKYLMTGDPKDLGVMHITSMKEYKATIETIAKLTGADRPPAPAVPPGVRDPVQAAVEVKGRKLSPEEADALRAARAKKREE